ncbi:hypothetical protein BKG82_27740 [Mycobacteroides chelonae]|uniref:Uncharacterized protein n=1 Tax=Mycobacteroides chelonae TaxID=1774 RepID=A0A1S1LGJ8_MYCCH|nr:hypothetical protein BKG82_27740 [Mycobacteroides chelonae]
MNDSDANLPWGTAVIRRAARRFGARRKNSRDTEPGSPAHPGTQTRHLENAERFVLTYAGGKLFRTREIITGTVELESRASQLGALVIYDAGARSGTLQANRYVVARFQTADPLGW